MDLDSL